MKEIEREIDGGRIEYEGSIWYGGYEYEFEIDGSTGNILQWEIDGLREGAARIGLATILILRHEN